MAQAKTRSKKASRPNPKPAAKTKRASPKRKSSSAKRSPAKQSPAASNGASARKASSNGHSHKATIPLVAGGAALAGTVGGLLLGASRSGDKVLGVSLPHPKRVQVKLRSSDLARAAKEVGRFGDNVGELTAELKRARQGLAGDNKHSSPIEVLLRGLTARR